MSSNDFKNLAYYLLITNYISNQNKLKRLLGNNDDKKDLEMNSLKNTTTTTTIANVAENIGFDVSLVGDQLMPVLLKGIQQRKHYNFVMTMLNRDSLLPESLWHNVHHQLCKDFIRELESSQLNLHQSASVVPIAQLVISCLGRSFILNRNVIHLNDITTSELFYDNSTVSSLF
ncbi:unnamed protein product [Heterobilharzia americana]|nr:unnamed protein product [Heterobilharzia americana]CAH8473375.1 unnamed protein product [Heterobilharzia americana]